MESPETTTTTEWVSVEIVCPFGPRNDRHSSIARVKLSDYNQYLIDGDAMKFTYLTPAERELFITGICDNCFPKDPDG